MLSRVELANVPRDSSADSENPQPTVATTSTACHSGLPAGSGILLGVAVIAAGCMLLGYFLLWNTPPRHS